MPPNYLKQKPHFSTFVLGCFSNKNVQRHTKMGPSQAQQKRSLGSFWILGKYQFFNFKFSILLTGTPTSLPEVDSALWEVFHHLPAAPGVNVHSWQCWWQGHSGTGAHRGVLLRKWRIRETKRGQGRRLILIWMIWTWFVSLWSLSCFSSVTSHA